VLEYAWETALVWGGRAFGLVGAGLGYYSALHGPDHSAGEVGLGFSNAGVTPGFAFPGVC
jgi:hypothetical protein